MLLEQILSSSIWVSPYRLCEWRVEIAFIVGVSRAPCHGDSNRVLPAGRLEITSTEERFVIALRVCVTHPVDGLWRKSTKEPENP